MERLSVLAVCVACQFVAFAAGADAQTEAEKKMEAAIKEALPTKPASITVTNVVKPLVHVKMTFAKDQNLGFKDLQYEAGYRLDGVAARVTVMATYKNAAGQEVKALTIAWDAAGKVINRSDFGEVKEKVAPVEARASEIRMALEKALGK
jgi:hypothetical protein